MRRIGNSVGSFFCYLKDCLFVNWFWVYEFLLGLLIVGVGFKKFKLLSRIIEDGFSCFFVYIYIEFVFFVLNGLLDFILFL